MTDSRGKAAPGAGDTHRGRALSFGGSLGGTPLTSYSKAKGRRTGRYRAPFSFLKVPTARKEKIGNGDNEIAAWLGRETRVVIETYDDPNRAAKEAVRHILNWGPEGNAPPKRGVSKPAALNGRVQVQCRRCFWAFGGSITTSDAIEWAFPRADRRPNILNRSVRRALVYL